MRLNALWAALALGAMTVIAAALMWQPSATTPAHPSTVAPLFPAWRDNESLNAAFRVTITERATLSYGWDNSHFGGRGTVYGVAPGEYTVQVLRWFDGSEFVAFDEMRSSGVTSGAGFYKLNSKSLPAGGVTYTHHVGGDAIIPPDQPLWLLEARHPSGFRARFGISVGEPLIR